MGSDKLFEDAFPFADDVKTLPVKDIDRTVAWYETAFGFKEVSRQDEPTPSVLMVREGIEIGFSINEKNPEEEGVAFLVSDAKQAREEIEANGVETGNWRIDERDGERYQVFFVVAPDGLCYYFHQLIE